MRRTVLRASVLLSTLPTVALAQTAEVRVRENVRAQPGGEVIAVLDPGARLQVVGARERWLEVSLEGWVWMQSLQATDRDGFDVVVSAAEGENLRARPSGEILGRLGRGTLLEELERIPGWIRARRVAWIWAPSVATAAASAGSGPSPRAPAAAPEQGDARAAPAVAARGPGGSGAAILAAPGGDTLAAARPGTELQVLAREGSWARVRVEGWAWLPDTDESAEEGVLRPTPAELAADPDRYRGSVVSWELQFLSLERAERIRTDFFEGEPFLLARHPSGAYVYVALAPERLSEALTLTPLERITVLGRVRTASSALTGSPIVDLLDLERSGVRR